MIDNHSIKYSPHCSSDARFEYQEGIKSRNTNKRKYLTGSKYKNLYNNTYNIMDNDNCKLVVKLDNGATTQIKVRTLPIQHELVKAIQGMETVKLNQVMEES